MPQSLSDHGSANKGVGAVGFQNLSRGHNWVMLEPKCPVEILGSTFHTYALQPQAQCKNQIWLYRGIVISQSLRIPCDGQLISTHYKSL